MIKKKYQKKLKLIFKKNIKIKFFLKKWEEIKRYYKEGLDLKNTFLQLFDNSNRRHIRKEKLKSKMCSSNYLQYVTFLIKPEFKLTVLLWRLNFFKTCYEASQSIHKGNVFLNSKRVHKSNIFFKKGDILSLKEENFFLILNLKKSSLSNIFYTFVEVDYYTRTLIIIKDFNKLTLNDFYILIPYRFNLKRFRDYL